MRQTPSRILDTSRDDVRAWMVGVEHGLSKRTLLYAEYSQEQNLLVSDTGPGQLLARDVVSIGMRHDF